MVNKEHKTLTFHAWYPGCPMEPDAYGIPKPKDTEMIVPTLLFVPCVGYAAGGYRLGYGGGFYDRTLATLQPALHRGAGFYQRLPGRVRARRVRPAAGRHPERQRRGLACVIPPGSGRAGQKTRRPGAPKASSRPVRGPVPPAHAARA